MEEKEQKELLDRLDSLHEAGNHKQIIYEISRLSPEERKGYQLQSRLARAYGNLGECAAAIKLLEPLRQEGEQDPLWWHRMACGYCGLGRYAQGADYLRRVLELGGEEDLIGQTRKMLRDIEAMGTRGRDGNWNKGKKGGNG